MKDSPLPAMIKRTILFLFIALYAVPLLSQTKEEKLSQLLQAYSNLHQFNGSVLVAQNGQVLLSRGYGYKQVARGIPNTAATIFQVGSITKQFTATVILWLAEKKKLNLSDKISKYFPGFPNGDSITIFNLLTHTSGIFNYTNDAEFMKTQATQPTNEKKILALFKDKKLDFSPGTQWNYSNSGYMMLGYIIEKVTGKSYTSVVRNLIFQPLHMTHSGFDFVNLADTNKATGYDNIDEKQSKVSDLVDSSVSFSAGALYTNTADLYAWHLAVLNNKIVGRAWMEKAFTPFKNKYGFGWGMDSIAGKRITGHGGGIFGFNANFVRVEDDNSCVVLLNNVGNPKLEEITKSVLAILNGLPYQLPSAKQEIHPAIEVLNKLTGTYEISPQFQIVITLEDGQLMAQASGQQKFQLFAQTETHFFLKVIDADLEFQTNDKGVVDKLKLIQGGRETPAVKIK